MDRNDGHDIRHYDSTEAIEASQQLGAETAPETRGFDPEEREYEDSREGFSTGGVDEGVQREGDGTVGTDDSHRLDEAATAEIYDEPAASLDFDPDTDPLGMGTDDDDDRRL